MDEKRLFIASCVALIATAMTFAVRGDIMGDFQEDFVVPSVSAEGGDQAAADALVKTRVGVIAGVAFFSFGLAILFGGPLVDALGMGPLLRLAAACHVGGVLLTIFAPNYYVVVAATLIVGAGNGLVEAVCNPLIATIYPTQKAHKLTVFHAWFPGGIVIGGLAAFALSQLGLGWQIKMATILVPAVIYTWMILGVEFPKTERVTAGVRFSGMFVEAFSRPLFWIIFAMMWFTASTELAPGAWIPNVFNDVMGEGTRSGILLLVWGNGLMYILRQFFARQAGAISPIALIAVTAPLAVAGLFLMGQAESAFMWFVAATFLYAGIAFWWPTMLGITSERCPRTGALGLAIIGATGSMSTLVSDIGVGYLNDHYGPAQSLQYWSVVPAILILVFGLVYLRDKAQGGYKQEVLEAAAE